MGGVVSVFIASVVSSAPHTLSVNEVGCERLTPDLMQTSAWKPHTRVSN